MQVHCKVLESQDDRGGHVIGLMHALPCKTKPPEHKHLPFASGLAPVGQLLTHLSLSLLYP